MSKRIRRVNYDIGDGDAGIYDTVDYMWNYALRDVKEPLIKELVASLKGDNDLDTLRNIYNWVWRNVEYELDPPDGEMVTSPIHFVNGNRRTGDCDCMTTLLVCLLESAGFESAITVVAWRIPEYTHVFAEVKYRGKWFVLDPTLKGGGFGKQDKKIHRFKRITKKEMGRLEVLADSPTASSAKKLEQNKKYDLTSEQLNKFARELNLPSRSCRGGGFGSDDWNRNSNGNNININFGTTTDSHSADTLHSPSVSVGADNNYNGGRILPPDFVPIIQNSYERYRQEQASISQSPSQMIVLYPNGDGTYRRGNYGEQNSSGVQHQDVNVGRIFSRPTPLPANIVSGNVAKKSIGRLGIINSNRPANVPNRARNYYQEFP